MIRLSGAVTKLDKKKPADASRDGAQMGHGKAPAAGKGTPGWANGLKQLYDEVVKEPLPDIFDDLLSKLDDKS
jgi:hypothetical protein